MNRRTILACAASAAALLGGAAPALAQSEPFIGQLMWVGFTYCPRGWTEANGQLLPIAQNTALFSLLGTTYGGDGRTTFALPDLRGRVAVHVGQGPGLPSYAQGQQFGVPTTTLTVAQMPSHTHAASTQATLQASNAAGDQAGPTGNVLADGRTSRVYTAGPSNVAMGSSSITAQTTVSPAGGNQPFNNAQPSLVVRACIALTGVFPSRN
ncbi:MAG TPA: tail fiber protein [Parvularculaceae bacterium]|nr:tail fiber protein [Parvularculaceae bacterium]